MAAAHLVNGFDMKWNVSKVIGKEITKKGNYTSSERERGDGHDDTNFS